MKTAIPLAWASLRAAPFQTILSGLSVAAAITLLSALSLLSSALSDGLQRNARGIDVIVGAKGSKLQLVLSGLYHYDVPNGNIDAANLDRLRRNKHVERAIPLVIGDSYRGWRVVGTSPEYIDHYGMRLAGGRMFDKPFEVVAGAATGLKIGDRFAASHGLSAGGGDVHDAHLYEVVGVMAPGGTALDRLLLTTVESVQQLHAHHERHGHHERHAEESPDQKADEQITAILVETRAPIDAINLARQIDRTTDMIAANPAYELARMSQTLGIGRDIVAIIGYVSLGLAALMLFSSLGSRLSASRYDLSVLRVLGATRPTLFAVIALQGVLIGAGGAVVGIVSGHIVALTIAGGTTGFEGIVMTRSMLQPGWLDGVLLMAGTVTGLLAALPPAVSAYRLDIAQLLAAKT